MFWNELCFHLRYDLLKFTIFEIKLLKALNFFEVGNQELNFFLGPVSVVLFQSFNNGSILWVHSKELLSKVFVQAFCNIGSPL